MSSGATDYIIACRTLGFLVIRFPSSSTEILIIANVIGDEAVVRLQTLAKFIFASFRPSEYIGKY